MSRESKHDAWSAGESYERYMGRWSLAIAREFVAWLDQPPGLDWLDIGCGTGALSATILERAAPRSLVGVDPSDGFVEQARHTIGSERARFTTGQAGSLPCDDGSIDVVTSALAYNFFPDRPAALKEMRRVVRPGGVVSFYVWDYPGGGMGFVDAFWKAAVAIDAKAEALVESRRFPFCTSDALLREVSDAGLSDAEVRAIETTTRFTDFNDFWSPFTLGAGPAPGYYLSLDRDGQERMRERLEAELGGGKAIEFPARAWAMRARAD